MVAAKIAFDVRCETCIVPQSLATTKPFNMKGRHMFKKIMAALLTAALCIGVFGTANAANKWVTKDLKWRSSKALSVIGSLDSTWRYNGGLADLDTSLAIDVSDMVNAADSLQFLRVELIGQNAFASGESVYVTFDGLSAGSDVWTVLGYAASGNTGPGGYCTGGTLVPGVTTGKSKWFIGSGSATAGHVSRGAGIAPGTGKGAGFEAYGNFSQFQTIRIRTHSDYAVVPVSNLVRMRVTYLSYGD